ncbi:hypothetical protein MXB_5146 [Myxobolus squamalis]|nr:hypothetical protein MXB_5146 [Myxobolus squamalis]
MNVSMLHDNYSIGEPYFVKQDDHKIKFGRKWREQAVVNGVYLCTQLVVNAVVDVKCFINNERPAKISEFDLSEPPGCFSWKLSDTCRLTSFEENTTRGNLAATREYRKDREYR